MFNELRTSVGLFLFLTIVCGLSYPFFVTGVGQTFFPHQANGSLIQDKDKTIGSQLIGQNFSTSRYFHPRPSAQQYDGMNSGASNLAPSSKILNEQIKTRLDALRKKGDLAPYPLDAVTASASGLDPHISPANAQSQMGRIAEARSLTVSALKDLIEQHTDKPTFGVLGEERINVLELNLALDQLAPPQP